MSNKPTLLERVKIVQQPNLGINVDNVVDLDDYNNWHGKIKPRPDGVVVSCKGNCEVCAIEEFYHYDGDNVDGIGLESKEEKPIAIIIKEHYRWLAHASTAVDNYVEKSLELYKEISNVLTKKGYKVHMLNPTSKLSYPDNTKVVVVHSVNDPKYINNSKIGENQYVELVILGTNSKKIPLLSTLSKTQNTVLGTVITFIISPLAMVGLSYLRHTIVSDPKHYELSTQDKHNLDIVKSVK